MIRFFLYVGDFKLVSEFKPNGDQPKAISELYEGIKKGDKYLGEKNYAAAMFEYEKASDLMPFEEEPKLKMQSIEATLGTEELAEVKRKVELAKKLEAEQLRKEAEAERLKTTIQKKSEFDEFLSDFQIQSRRDSIRKAIFEAFAEELKRVEQGKDMLARSAVYRKIADAFRQAKDEEIALKYYQKALEIEEKYGKEDNVSTVYEQMADVYYSAGDFQRSISIIRMEYLCQKTTLWNLTDLERLLNRNGIQRQN
mgnify:CR=1 FL=1